MIAVKRTKPENNVKAMAQWIRAQQHLFAPIFVIMKHRVAVADGELGQNVQRAPAVGAVTFLARVDMPKPSAITMRTANGLLRAPESRIVRSSRGLIFWAASIMRGAFVLARVALCLARLFARALVLVHALVSQSKRGEEIIIV